MAVREREQLPAAERRERPQLRPRQNFETWSWFFMRVSGLVLLFLALLHFALVGRCRACGTG